MNETRTKHGSAALIALAAGIALAVGAAGVVGAGDDNDEMSEQEAVRQALQRGEVLPLVRILAITAGKVPGDVVEVELEREHGRIVYEIKVLTKNGRVREVRLDARSGDILKIEDD